MSVLPPHDEKPGEIATAEIVERIAVGIGGRIVREMLNYASYYFKVPVLFCFVGLAFIIVIILQETYPRIAAATVFPLLALLPQTLHLDTAAFVKVYGFFSTTWYIVSLPLRKIYRGRPPVTYWSQFKIMTIFATAGWGIVLCHVPVMRIAPGATRIGLAGVFLFFYLLTLASFAAALCLSSLGDLIF